VNDDGAKRSDRRRRTTRRIGRHRSVRPPTGDPVAGDGGVMGWAASGLPGSGDAPGEQSAGEDAIDKTVDLDPELFAHEELGGDSDRARSAEAAAEESFDVDLDGNTDPPRPATTGVNPLADHELDRDTNRPPQSATNVGEPVGHAQGTVDIPAAGSSPHAFPSPEDMDDHPTAPVGESRAFEIGSGPSSLLSDDELDRATNPPPRPTAETSAVMSHYEDLERDTDRPATAPAGDPGGRPLDELGDELARSSGGASRQDGVVGGVDAGSPAGLHGPPVGQSAAFARLSQDGHAPQDSERTAPRIDVEALEAAKQDLLHASQLDEPHGHHESEPPDEPTDPRIEAPRVPSTPPNSAVVIAPAQIIGVSGSTSPIAPPPGAARRAFSTPQVDRGYEGLPDEDPLRDPLADPLTEAGIAERVRSAAVPATFEALPAPEPAIAPAPPPRTVLDDELSDRATVDDEPVPEEVMRSAKAALGEMDAPVLETDLEELVDVEAVEAEDLTDSGPQVSRTPPPPPPDPRPKASAKPPPPPPGRAPDAADPTAKAASVKPPPRRKRPRQWWETFFSDDYLMSVLMPTPLQVARQVDFVEASLGLKKGSTILDVGCGLGLQAIELTRRGYLVVGLDLSLAMITRAAENAQHENLKINFLHADIREIEFEGAFDGVICLGTTFGFFDDDQNRDVLSRLHSALKPGGRIFIDVVNRDHVIESQPNLVWFEGDDCVCMEESEFNFFSSRLAVKRTMMREDGYQSQADYSVRLYSLHELGLLVQQMGFRVIEVSGHEAMRGVFFGTKSARILMLAERRVRAQASMGPMPPKL